MTSSLKSLLEEATALYHLVLGSQPPKAALARLFTSVRERVTRTASVNAATRAPTGPCAAPRGLRYKAVFTTILNPSILPQLER